MPYDHARKAGNRGDVWKHFTLVSIIERIANRDGFRYFESHSGAPVHQLQVGGEWRRGIGDALNNGSTLRDHPYFVMAAELVKLRRYPAGWWLAANRLATKVCNVDVLLTDMAEPVSDQYRDCSLVAPALNVRVQFEQTDGFSRIQDGVDANLVFIDPPFHPHADADWKALGKACSSLSNQGASFLAWYPIYWETRPQALVDFTGCRSWEVTWAQYGAKASQNLKGCGMLVSPDLSKFPMDADLQTLARCLGGVLRVRRPSAE